VTLQMWVLAAPQSTIRMLALEGSTPQGELWKLGRAEKTVLIKIGSRPRERRGTKPPAFIHRRTLRVVVGSRG
jgi:hypothetical protein